MTFEELEHALELKDLIDLHESAAHSIGRKKDTYTEMLSVKEGVKIEIGEYKYSFEFGVKILDMLIDYHENSKKELQEIFDKLETTNKSVVEADISVYSNPLGDR